MSYRTNLLATTLYCGAKPGIMANMNVGVAGFSGVDRHLKRRLHDAAAALGLLIYLAPVLAVAAVAVRLVGSGPIFQRHETVTTEGQRVSLLRFRTAPSPKAGPWRCRVLAFLRVTRVTRLPALVDVLRGEVELLTAVKAV